MKKLIKISFVLLVTTSIIAAGCSSSKKGQCGCPAKQGMVGYK